MTNSVMQTDAVAIGSRGFCDDDTFSLAGLGSVADVKPDPKEAFAENESTNRSASKGLRNGAKSMKKNTVLY